MAEYANQHTVKVCQVNRNKANLYAMVNIEANWKAMREMKGAGYALWLYINSNQNNYKFDLSQAHFSKVTGYKKTSYYDALRILKEKGYLVEREGIFMFLETGDKNDYPLLFEKNDKL